MTAADLELRRRLRTWRPEVTGTLMFVTRPRRGGGRQVLLIHKKSGHGAGKINGPGGKVEPGESVADAAVRETREEVGLVVRHARAMARLRFVERHGLQWLGFAYVADDFEGTPIETDEARPQWFAEHRLPFGRMWPDDRHWLPRVLAGERLLGDFLFDEGRLVAHDIRPAARIRTWSV